MSVLCGDNSVMSGCKAYLLRPEAKPKVSDRALCQGQIERQNEPIIRRKKLAMREKRRARKRQKPMSG